MGSFSLTHWLVVILVIVLLFGRGRISDLMGDFAKGINSFKKGMAEWLAANPDIDVIALQEVRAETKDRAIFYMVDEILKEHPLGK